MRKQMMDYQGNYTIKRRPAHLALHNAKTWTQIEAEITRHGASSFDRLTILCKDHNHGDKSANHPYQFVTYCIRQKWLEQVL